MSTADLCQLGRIGFVADSLGHGLTRYSRDPIEGAHVVEAVGTALKTIDAPDAVIILVGVDPAVWNLRRSEDFQWAAIPQDIVPSPDGLFRGHPVYQVHEVNKSVDSGRRPTRDWNLAPVPPGRTG
jgi:hypothetical protein